jgi:tRNA pseudouridine55 synthase
MKQSSNEYTRLDDGLLLIDKEAGWTSNDVVQKVKGLLKAKKVGHTGTLDPDATGLLVLCINGATRWAQNLTDLAKEYRATLRLGQATDSGDASGTVIDQADVPFFAEKKIQEALSQFQGEILQEVPLYSAVKVRGKRLYKYARQGQEVVLPKRQVTIHEIALEAWNSPALSIRVRCSKGTYIRSLAVDIGKALGVPAHLSALQRTELGPFSVDQAFNIAELESRLERPETLTQCFLDLPGQLADPNSVAVAEARADKKGQL